MDMNMFSKISAVVLILLGEGFSVYAEMIVAQKYGSSSSIRLILKMSVVAFIAGLLLILGYALGFKAFRNIWVVSVASVTSILIVEPLIVYAVFHELPNRGAAVGLILGALGFIATMVL